MRISGQKVALPAVAALFASAAMAQQPGPWPQTVNLRLSPDLGDAVPAVRAALLGLPAVRIAEPADYELTTKRDYPLTLIANDARQPREEWQNDFTREPVRPAPRRAELGNLGLGNFRGRLRLLIDRRDRANRLMNLAMSTRQTEVETCLAADTDSSEPANCHRRRIRMASGDQPPPDDLLGDGYPSASLRNRSTRPLYFALLAIDPSAGISLIAPRNGTTQPLAPGATATGLRPRFGSSSGIVALVTITSDRPIDTSAVEQAPIDDAAWDDCLSAAAGCARPAMTIPADWSMSVAEYHHYAHTLVGIGGGFPVTEGMAPWMAEIYSTLPFTAQEIADDAQAPEGKRKFLAQRRPQERDHRCGGSLIAPNLLITAAHCVANSPFTPATMNQVLTDRRVRLGSKRLGRGGWTMAIAGVTVPASYVPGRQQDDIALLLLRPDRDSRPYDDTFIPLGQKPISAGTDVTAFGWGYTGVVAPGANALFNIADELQRNPDQLQYGMMRALAWDACRQRLKAKLGPGMVCLVAPGGETGAVPDKNVFSCRGDSGGPLVRKDGDVEELVGVTSWSMGCGYRNMPSVYTDVTKYRRWITAATEQLKPKFTQPVDEKAAPSGVGERRQSN